MIYPIFDKTANRQAREKRLGQKGHAFWFTGLSGSGKSTIAIALEKSLLEDGFLPYVLDGDNLRHGLCSDLGFSEADRKENLRRAAEVAKLLVDAGIICICAFISPTIESRENARKIIGDDAFTEVFIDTPLEVCESRDVKGLYAKARAGLIKDFTGISAPYEAPPKPNILVHSDKFDIHESAFIIKAFYIKSILGVLA